MLISVPDPTVMRRLKQAAAAQRRADEKVRQLVIEAVDAGENQSEIARIIGRSREHVRLIRRRADQG